MICFVPKFTFGVQKIRFRHRWLDFLFSATSALTGHFLGISNAMWFQRPFDSASAAQGLKVKILDTDNKFRSIPASSCIPAIRAPSSRF